MGLTWSGVKQYLFLMNDVFVFGGGSGMGSVVVFLVRALAYRMLHKKEDILHIDDRQCSPLVKRFFRHFIDLEKMGEVHFVSGDIPDKNEVFNNEAVNSWWYGFNKEDRLAVCRSVFAQRLAFKPWVRDCLAGIEKAEIGLCIRRGDKKTLEAHLPLLELDQYRDYVNERGAKRIYIATDDFSTIEELRELEPSWEISFDARPDDKGFFLADSWHWSEVEIDAYCLKFCRELYSLSVSDQCVADSSTNVYGILLYMRDDHYSKLTSLTNNFQELAYF
jgi:hypothetical protein